MRKYSGTSPSFTLYSTDSGMRTAAEAHATTSFIVLTGGRCGRNETVIAQNLIITSRPATSTRRRFEIGVNLNALVEDAFA